MANTCHFSFILIRTCLWKKWDQMSLLQIHRTNDGDIDTEQAPNTLFWLQDGTPEQLDIAARLERLDPQSADSRTDAREGRWANAPMSATAWSRTAPCRETLLEPRPGGGPEWRRLRKVLLPVTKTRNLYSAVPSSSVGLARSTAGRGASRGSTAAPLLVLTRSPTPQDLQRYTTLT